MHPRSCSMTRGGKARAQGGVSQPERINTQTTVLRGDCHFEPSFFGGIIFAVNFVTRAYKQTCGETKLFLEKQNRMKDVNPLPGKEMGPAAEKPVPV